MASRPRRRQGPNPCFAPNHGCRLRQPDRHGRLASLPAQTLLCSNQPACSAGPGPGSAYSIGRRRHRTARATQTPNVRTPNVVGSQPNPLLARRRATHASNRTLSVARLRAGCCALPTPHIETQRQN